MLSTSRENNPLSKSIWFETNPNSTCTSYNEGFNKSAVSTSRKKLIPLTEISAKIARKEMVSTNRNNVLL